MRIETATRRLIRSTTASGRHRAAALGGCVLVEDIAHALGTVVGDFDTDMRLICYKGCAESFLFALRFSGLVFLPRCRCWRR